MYSLQHCKRNPKTYTNGVQPYEIARNRSHQELHPLRKHAYWNTWKISPPKTESFSDKSYDSCHISAQNRDCGYSLEPPMRRLIRVYSVCHLFSKFQTRQRIVNCTCSNCRTSIVRSWGVRILRVNTVFLFYFLSCWGCTRRKNITEVIQEMPQSRYTTFPRRMHRLIWVFIVCKK